MCKINCKYAYLMDMKDKAETKAIEMAKKGEEALAKFYKNGAVGFEMKAKKLTIEEAGI